MKKRIAVIIIVLCGVLVLIGCKKQDAVKRKQTVFGSGFELCNCEQLTEEDIYELCGRIRDKDPEEFEAVLLTNKFHQHVGPNNIYGVKMGLYAKKLLLGEDHMISVLSEAGEKPPVSCLNDGIMASIGATLGRGLIHMTPNSSRLAATFYYNDKAVRLEVKPEKLKYTQEFIKKSLKKYNGLTKDYFRDVRKMGLSVWENYRQDELFNVSYLDVKDERCAYNTLNVNALYNELHELMHLSPTHEQIIVFIDKHPCASDGTVSEEGHGMTVTFTWKSNNLTMTFKH